MRCDTAASRNATSACDRNMYGRGCAAPFGAACAPCSACGLEDEGAFVCAAAPAGIAAESAAADFRKLRRPLDSLMAFPFFEIVQASGPGCFRYFDLIASSAWKVRAPTVPVGL